MEKNERKLIKHSVGSLLVCVLCLTLAMIGGSYAYMTDLVTHDNNSSDIQLLYDESVNKQGDVITLNTNVPQSDMEGMSGKSYQFSLKNRSEEARGYEIQIVNDTAMIATDGCENNLLDLAYLRYNVNNEEAHSLMEQEESGYTVYYGVLNPKETKNFAIHMWVREDAEEGITTNLHYHGRLVVKEVK